MKLRRLRAGFTLVEMLVATALIMFIMLILSEAFVQGIDAFRLLKGIGDMEERIRTATTVIGADLVADHFEGKRRLSDHYFWNQGNPREGYFSLSQGTTPTIGSGIGFTPVLGTGQQTFSVASTQGPSFAAPDWFIQVGTYLLIDTGPNQDLVQVTNVTPPGSFTAVFILPHNPPVLHNPPFLIRVLEGIDADFLPSMRATDHILAMTVKLRGNRPEDFFSANLPWTSPFFPILLNPAPPPATIQNPTYARTTFFDQPSDARYQDQFSAPPVAAYKSQWAEVGYFLLPNGSTANGTRLFGLYRCQFVVVPDNSKLNVPPTNPPPPIPLSMPNNLPLSWANDGYTDMSCQPLSSPVNGNLYYYFNNPSDLANIPQTFSPNPIGTGQQTVTPASMSGASSATGMGWSIQPGSTLLMDSGPSAETVVVTAVTPTTFTATFANSHPNPTTIGIMTRAFVAALAGLRGTFDPTTAQLWSATLVVTDVVSFDVKILPDLPGYTDFGDIVPVPGWPFRAYDTALPPLATPYPIKAVQITLRVWDVKTQQTRQVTMIQDM